MDKFIKINSVQGGDFTNGQNLVDFVLPSSLGVVDLRDSYINLNTKINTTEVSNAEGDGVYAVELKWNSTSNPKFVNAALVKNCHLRSDTRGQIENVRRIDQYRQLMSTYTRSQREAFCDSYLASNQLQNPQNNNRFGVYREINKVGTVKSRNLDINPIQISLADLFGFCENAPEVDLGKLGTLRVHLELNRDKMSSEVKMIDETTEWASEDLKKMNGISAVGAANQVTTTTKFTNLNLSPFWCGQAVLINADHTDGGGSNITDKRAVIASIEWDKTGGGAFNIQFTESWGTLAATKVYSNIRVTPYKDVTTDVEVNYAEIVVKRVSNPVGINAVQFETFSTEQTNGLKLTSYQNQFSCEGDAKDIVIAFPDNDTDLISNNNNLQSFRLRLNNQDLTDREINVKSSLYYDRLNMTVGNMGNRLKNLFENQGDVSQTAWADVYSGASQDIVSIMNPLYITDREKFLQVNINGSGNGVEKLTLFKILPRVIDI